MSEAGNEDHGNVKADKKDLKRLLKIALEVELSEKEIGDVGKVYMEL